jgi:hypothetical protein
MYELNIYQIFEHNKAAFHDRFRDHAARLMRRHDFDIVAIWEARSDAGPEFVYLLRWPDEPTMNRRWDAFMADPEWARIKAETTAIHGELFGHVESRLMDIATYSPGLL